MAFQGLLKEDGAEPKPIAEFTGAEIIGSRVAAPYAVHKEVYVVPMETVSASKVRIAAHACASAVVLRSCWQPLGNGRCHLRAFRLAR